MTIFRCMTLFSLLAMFGCAGIPLPKDSAPQVSTPPTATGISFDVVGEPRGAEECFVRHDIAYPEDIQPVELSLELETEMKREDDSWMVIAWTEGIREQLPSVEAVGKPDGGGAMHTILTEELLLACDQLRFRVIVHACDPAPCPPLSAGDRSNPFEVLVEDRSAN